MSPEFLERFWAKVAVVDPELCWEWQAAKWVNGYGVLKHPTKRRNIGAHRMSYWIATGSDPVGLAVCHRCDNPGCVNPAHLFTGTLADNNLDMRAKGRHVPPPRHAGVNHPKAKLDELQVRAIRAQLDAGASVHGVAKRLGMSCKTITALWRRETWKHVG